jgi:hypothetical protein
MSNALFCKVADRDKRGFSPIFVGEDFQLSVLASAQQVIDEQSKRSDDDSFSSFANSVPSSKRASFLELRTQFQHVIVQKQKKHISFLLVYVNS